MIKINLFDIADTKHLARDIAQMVNKGDIITLSGDLGTGKTAFSKFMIQYLAQEEIEVTSPTFTLMNLYQTAKVNIHHFDLYRLKSAEEVYELGIEEAFENGLSLIEWPQIITNILPENRIDIIFYFTDDRKHRYASVIPSGKWKQNFMLVVPHDKA